MGSKNITIHFFMGKNKTKNEFVEDANLKHSYKYNYDKVDYKTNKDKVLIICPEHGGFMQRPDKHLQGNGCPYCQNNIHKTFDEFIKQSKEVHGDKYDYSKVKYVNNKTKVCIICPEHGEFWQLPKNHIHRKQGCPKCANVATSERCRLTTEDFIIKAKEIHDDKYDYSKVNYLNMKTKVLIVCNVHGEFWQTPTHHITMKCGCPKCNRSHLEYEVENLLYQNNVKFEYQKRFKWLGKQSLDFYLPEYNIAIECQGRQHFESVDYFGGEDRFQKQLELDKLKKLLCDKNNINLIYYTDFIDANQDMIKTKEKLIKTIFKKKDL